MVPSKGSTSPSGNIEAIKLEAHLTLRATHAGLTHCNTLWAVGVQCTGPPSSLSASPSHALCGPPSPASVLVAAETLWRQEQQSQDQQWELQAVQT